MLMISFRVGRLAKRAADVCRLGLNAEEAAHDARSAWVRKEPQQMPFFAEHGQGGGRKARRRAWSEGSSTLQLKLLMLARLGRSGEPSAYQDCCCSSPSTDRGFAPRS